MSQEIFAQAVAMHRQGRLEEALRLCAAVAAAGGPPAAEARYLSALVQYQQGDAAAALAAVDAALARDPGMAKTLMLRAVVLDAGGDDARTLAAYDRALAAQPGQARAWMARGAVLERLRRFADAAGSYARALALDPDLTQAHLDRARLLCTRLNKPRAALAVYDALLARQPQAAVAYAHRADAKRWMGDAGGALDDLDRAASLMPASAEIRASRGLTLLDLLRFDAAMADFDRAIALDPAYPRGPFNKGLALLLQGRWQEGWPLYEKRPRPADPPGPRLQRGDALARKHLYLHREQGLGDMIQFARYARLAAAQGARVTLPAPPGLMRLFEGLGAGIAIVPADAPPPAFDAQAPLLSLPHFFDTSEASIPEPEGYLAADPALAAQWGARIGGPGFGDKGFGDKGFRVGICWQGNIETDPSRSFPLSAAAVLASVPGVRLISLQKGDAATDGVAVESLGDAYEAGDFADTAAVMANLDLIVSCDTAVAHLAGALGRPAFVALKHLPDWRWQLERADNPWYRGMTLFRQQSAGDWQAPFRAMAEKLAALVQT